MVTKANKPAKVEANLTAKYQHTGPYDKGVFQAEFVKVMASSGQYNSAATQDVMVLLGLIERDINITDIRWAAYMLATVTLETTSPMTVTTTRVDKKGRTHILKHQAWLITMSPVNEVGRGKGRDYHEPVKVKVLPTGSIRITEKDGDQFNVTAAGVISPATKTAVMGVTDGLAAAKIYKDDDGDEFAYFGRGYVQLTWWSNYAAAGLTVGRGMDLLTDPEVAKEPAVAYGLMSYGMRTGKGFANGHRFTNYFTNSETNYVGARRMVNGHNKAKEIAALAEKYEAILLKAANGKSNVLPQATP